MTIQRVFSPAEIAEASLPLLGDGWSVEPGPWNVSCTISGPYVTSFVLRVDEEGPLVIDYNGLFTDDAFPQDPVLPDGVLADGDGVLLTHADVNDFLEKLAQQVANAIRAITGR
ncbi:hypothetical protein ABT246_24645 [Streptomyces sp. NPDC001553]|uniref:hypothetical protein n=1 Tax=Streptomyces sp. NPDC001553 TaxID=3154385 RepID=UPI003324794C